MQVDGNQTEKNSADFVRQYQTLREAGSRLFESIGLDNISLSQLRRLAEGSRLVNKEAGETIEVTHQYVYEILSGYVAVYDQEARPRSLLAWRVPGDLLGDFYFINPEAAGDFQDHFVATDSCRLLRFDADILRQLIQNYSILLWGISQQLARKAINSRIRAQIRSHKDSFAQMAQLILELIKERGLGGKDGLSLIGTYTYHDFEDFLGCSYSAISKACDFLKRRRCIEHLEENANSRKFRILSRDSLVTLRRIAEDGKRATKDGKQNRIKQRQAAEDGKQNRIKHSR
jgi:CRP-like cAMP-binding protein